MEMIKGIYTEIILSIGIVFILFLDMFLNNKNSKKILGRACIGILLLSLSSICFNVFDYLTTIYFFDSNIVIDTPSIFFKILFIVGGIITSIFILNFSLLDGKKTGEFFSMFLGAILGTQILAISNNLILFLIGFEMLSICSYVMAGASRNEKSLEASYKYSLYGAVSSACMIVGFSYIYGMVGATLDITTLVFSVCDMISLRINLFPISIASLLIFAGIGYKLSLFPFHFWTPDVYDGAPTPISAFLSVVSKSAGFCILFKFVIIPFSVLWYEYLWSTSSLNLYQIFVGFIALCTMCYGNFVALKQENLKRLMAYSSIAQAGYMMLALSSGSKGAINAVMFYLIVYLFMNFVVFYFINFSNKILKKEDILIDDVKGFGQKFPFISICVFISLISLAGIPPTAGFSGKFLLFDSLIKTALSYEKVSIGFFYFLTLAILGVINSVISLYYYMKITKVLFFVKSEREDKNEDLKEVYSLNLKTLFFEKAFFLILTIPIFILLNFGIAKNLFN